MMVETQNDVPVPQPADLGTRTKQYPAEVGAAALALSPGLSAKAILNCLAGVTYLTDQDGILLAFSPDPVTGSAQGFPSGVDESPFVGRSLFAAIGSQAVREASQLVHRAVWSGQLSAFGFEYRCDEPELKRSMWLSVGRVDDAGTPVAVLYQSLMLSETPRAPIGLFDPSNLIEGEKDQAVLRLCSYCHAVAWPVGDEAPEWIEPAEYYRRGGADHVPVSHGICGSCFERIVQPTLLALKESPAP